jgi:hypothetical protein
MGVEVVLQAREGDGPAGRCRELLHPAELVALGRQVARHLEDAVTDLPERAPDPEQLILAREGAGHRFAVDGAVQQRARRREAERARGEALAKFAMRSMSSAVGFRSARSPIT